MSVEEESAILWCFVSKVMIRATSLPRLLQLPPLRTLVVWLSCVLLLAQAGHLTLVSHTVCAVHGELLHGESETGVRHAHRDDGHLEDDAHIHSNDVDDDGHGHCDAIATEHGHGIERAAQPAAIITWVMLSASSSARYQRFTSRLYLLAPKTSPPAAQA